MQDQVSKMPPRRVLFVDDEELIRITFERTLAGEAFEVTTAESAEKGLEALAEGSFGVVLADFHMPGMSGIEFLDAVKERSPDTVRILVSGRGDFKTAIKVINEVGLFKFIVKPWNHAELISTIERATEHFELTLKNRALTKQLSEKVDELESLNQFLETEVQDRTANLLSGLINALDFRDTETQSHSRRVSLYAAYLADSMGLDDTALLDVKRGALLHDLGKIGVSDTILLKPGKLTDEEWVEMRKHSEYGYRMIKQMAFLGDARRLVLEHHERWDGKGYPGGLEGDDVCVGARIFAVIDTYDAMTSDRPYRKALSHEVATAEIMKMSGTQFDPEIAKAWLDIPESHIRTLKEHAETRSAMDAFREEQRPLCA